MTYKWLDKIWIMSMRRGGTFQSCFWKSIWGRKLLYKPAMKRQLLAFECWECDTAWALKTAYLHIAFASSWSKLRSSSRTLWLIFGEMYPDILTLNLIINTLGPPPFILDYKKHSETRKTCCNTLAHKRLASGRLSCPLTFDFQTL